VAIVCGKGKTNAVQQTKMTQTKPTKNYKKKLQKIVQQQHKQREMVVPLRFHGQLKAKIAFTTALTGEMGGGEIEGSSKMPTVKPPAGGRPKGEQSSNKTACT